MSSSFDTERYAQEGFAVVKSVASKDKLKELQEESNRLIAYCFEHRQRLGRRVLLETDAEESANLGINERMSGVIRKIEPLIDISPVFAEFAFDDSVCYPATAVFDENVELFEDKLNLKLPGGSGFVWHQDWSCCWRAHTDRLVTCFIYIDDSTRENGCLDVIPGSHQGKRICDFRKDSNFEVDPRYIDDGEIVRIALNAGDMIVFDPYLLHHSEPNRTKTPRRSIIYTYNPLSLGLVTPHRFPSEV